MKNFCLSFFFFLFFPPILTAQFDVLGETISPIVSIDYTTTVDIDDDGDIDILTIGNDKINWFENVNGNGSFAEVQTLYENEDFTGDEVHAVDWDNDSDLDLFVCGNTPYKLLYFENMGSIGYYNEPIELIQSLGLSRDFKTVDIDNDGFLDYFYIGNLGTDRNILFHRGTGSINENISEEIITIDIDLKAEDFDFADVDLDGDLDMIASFDAGETGLYWYENLGNGEFSTGNSIASNNTTNYVDDIELGDFNGDGRIDILALYGLAEMRLVLYKYVEADEGFTEIVDIDLNISLPRLIESIDADGDGDLDILFGAGLNNTGAYFYENINGEGEFGPKETFFQTNNTNSLHAEDVNNDGQTDVIATFTGEERLVWFENENQGETFTLNRILSIGERYTSMDFGDINGDGKEDIITSAPQDDFVYLHLRQDAENLFFEPQAIPLLNFVTEVKFRDIDEDGDLDIFAGKYDTSTDKILWLENTDGQGAFDNIHIIVENEDLLNGHVHYIDFDSDGDEDIVWMRIGAGNSREIVWKENINESIEFAEIVSIFNIVDFTDISKTLIGDVNGDGYSDILYTDFLDIKTIVNSGDNTNFALQTILTSIGTVDFLQFDDLNNDNIDDLVVGLDNGVIYQSLSTEELGIFSPLMEVYSSSQGILFLRIFDYDGDADNDIIITNTRIQLIENTDGLGTMEHLSYLESSIVTNVALNDFDSDGDLDILASRFDNTMRVHYNYEDETHLTGTVFWDENENGIFDTEEAGIENNIVKIEPIGLTGFTRQNGTYSTAVAQGTYDLECIPYGAWDFTTDSEVSVVVDSPTFTAVNDFGLVPSLDTTYFDLNITSGPTRCGFIVPFWINYSGYSNQRENGRVELTLDSLVTFVSATVAPIFVSDSLLVWEFEDLVPTQIEAIKVNFEIASADFLGEYINMETRLLIENEVSELNIMDTVLFNSQINCGYDPNDKMVEPNVEDYTNFITQGEELLYTIRFQNTGTDTAFNIRIDDRLDENLDWESFRLVAASHPVYTELDASGKVSFHFEDILLPWEAIDTVGSQGFVKYSINMSDSIPENTYILNQAEIYFDFNDPIITNMVDNVFVSEIALDFTIQNPSCPDSSDGLIIPDEAHPDLMYIWNNEINTAENFDLAAGEYNLQAFLRGSLLLDTTLVLSPLSDLTTQISSNPENGFNQDASATVVPVGGVPPYSYLWNTIPVQTTETAVNLSTGEYEVIVTDAEDCSITQSIFVDRLTDISEIEKDYTFSISPNPSSGEARISFALPNTDEYWKLEVTRVNGQIIYSESASTLGSVSADLILTDLQTGVYFVTLKTQEKRFSRKLVVIAD